MNKREPNFADIFVINIYDSLNEDLISKVDAFVDPDYVISNDYSSRTMFYSFDATLNREGFHVICMDRNDTVIGYIFCISNTSDPGRWLYADLQVMEEYRRMHIASMMVKCACNEIERRNGYVLCCDVSPNNVASINLQLSLGFIRQKSKEFDDYIEEDAPWLYFEKELSLNNSLSISANIPRMAYYIYKLNELNSIPEQNMDISIQDIEKKIKDPDSDDKYYIIMYKQCPVAYVELNILREQNILHINNIVVNPAMYGRKIENYIIHCAEDMARSNGISEVSFCLHTSNLSLKRLFESCGYHIKMSTNKDSPTLMVKKQIC